MRCNGRQEHALLELGGTGCPPGSIILHELDNLSRGDNGRHGKNLTTQAGLNIYHSLRTETHTGSAILSSGPWDIIRSTAPLVSSRLFLGSLGLGMNMHSCGRAAYFTHNGLFYGKELSILQRLGLYQCPVIEVLARHARLTRDTLATAPFCALHHSEGA